MASLCSLALTVILRLGALLLRFDSSASHWAHGFAFQRTHSSPSEKQCCVDFSKFFTPKTESLRRTNAKTRAGIPVLVLRETVGFIHETVIGPALYVQSG